MLDVIGRGSAKLRPPSVEHHWDAADGGFYFTDPGDSGEKPTGSVGYVDKEWHAHIIAGGLRYSNGIVLRPDGKTLLVGSDSTVAEIVGMHPS